MDTGRFGSADRNSNSIDRDQGKGALVPIEPFTLASGRDRSKD
jgi:hypothetical protein